MAGGCFPHSTKERWTIDHIVALAEAYDSGLPESRFRELAADIDNLTIARPDVNRNQKSDRDAGEWRPPRNQGGSPTA